MKEFAIVLLQNAHTTLILFDSRADVDRYVSERADMLAECYLWYIVKVLERSKPEVAAGIDLLTKDRAS
jgi:hypothetical protein